MAPEKSTALTADNITALALALTALTAETFEALTALIFNSLSVARLQSTARQLMQNNVNTPSTVFKVST